MVLNARKSVHSETNRRRFFLTRGDYEWPEKIFKHRVGGPGKAVSFPMPRASVAYGRILTLEAATDLEPYLLDSLAEQPLAAFRQGGWNLENDGALSFAVLQSEPKLRALRSELEG